MLKIGIIGCGKIADQHAEQIGRIPGCEIVGVCDSEELMAKQMCDRFPIGHCFNDVGKLLDVSRPDVVHITTPPQSHFALGKLCLEAGSNVYIEKPFALNTDETEGLISIAKDRNLKLTVGHNAQFTQAAIRMRELIGQGFLGGAPVHMESYYCYNFADQSYAKALLGDRQHWVRKLPGKLLHNIISHGISKIAEFFPGDSADVIAHGSTSPLLRSINEPDIVDELRVILSDKSGTTAYFTFSSQICPALHQFRIYGRENSLIIDDDHQTLIKVTGKQYKSYLNQFVPPYYYAKQYMVNLRINMMKFLRAEFHNDAGMKYLIESFYKSVTDNAPLPISYREILLTAKIMDAIFCQIHSNRTSDQYGPPDGGEYPRGDRVPVCNT
jgi:predicted dehydrogenase